MAVPVLAGVLAQLAALSVPTKAALGVGVALGAVGGGPVIAAAAGAADPLDAGAGAPAAGAPPAAAGSDPAEPADPVEPVEETGADEDGSGQPGQEGTTDEGAADEGEAQPPAASDFGRSVSADARDGGVDGQEIRARAHERNALRAAERAGAGAEDGDDVPPVQEPEQPSDEPDGAPADEIAEPAPASTTPDAKPGHGRGGGKGPRP